MAWTLAVGCESKPGACDQHSDCSPARACYAATCQAGKCTDALLAAGAPCGVDSKVCDGAGQCVECVAGADCTSGLCEEGVCSDSCGDGIANGSESDADCGGVCEGCTNGKGCASAADCVSKFCDQASLSGTCAPCIGDADCGEAALAYCEEGNCTSQKKLGEPCTATNQCESGFCVDATCCDATCDGVCVSCRAADTGASDGSCAPVFPKTDPDSECASEPASSCGATGEGCNGDADAPGCIRFDSATECTPAQCQDGSQTTAALCDGGGTCIAGTTSACAPYQCGSAACLTSCDDDPDCVEGFFCDLASNSCKAQGDTGKSCQGDNQCSSGSCSDGVCCNKTCGGGCDACSVAKGATIDGACTTVAAGVAGDPSCEPYVCSGEPSCPNSCSSDAQCVATHYCDSTACQPKKDKGGSCAGNNQCQSGNCSDSVCCDAACSGPCDVCAAALGATADGTCSLVADNLQGNPSCSPYLCDGKLASCPSSCLDHLDCVSDDYCSATKCVAKKLNGTSCTKAVECQSGACVDGRCCMGTCDGLCQACNVLGREGTCSPVANGSDPASECVGHCDGAGSCATATYSFDAQPIFKKYCSNCHVNGNSGGTNFAQTYDKSQLAANTCAGKTTGACALVRIKNGSMRPGAGCTGNPVLDVNNAMCLTAPEQADIQAWIDNGQLP